MSNETYMVIAPNGMKIPFDKNTNLFFIAYKKIIINKKYLTREDNVLI